MLLKWCKKEPFHMYDSNIDLCPPSKFGPLNKGKIVISSGFLSYLNLSLTEIIKQAKNP